MRIKILIGCIVFLFMAGNMSVVYPEPAADFMNRILPFENLELSGYFKNESSWRAAHKLNQMMKLKNIVALKANYKIADGIEFYTELNTWYDAVYDIESRYKDVSSGRRNIRLRMPTKQEWLRECYLDIFTPKLDMRFGRQQVAWGTTDGVRILDVVNPLDYREWTIKDYSEIRIPLWMFKFEAALMKNGHLQLLLIPDYQPNYYAPAGSPFTLRTVEIAAQPTTPIIVTTIDEQPGRKIENTKIGLRWRKVLETGPLSGLEYTLNYLHTYDSASSAYTRLSFPVLYLTRRAEQIDVFGGSFAKTITKGIFGDFGKGWTIRGEFAYIKNGAMNYGTDANIRGTVDVDQYNYALGFDKAFFTKYLFSFQFVQLIADTKEDYDKGQYTLLFGPTRGPLDKVETLLTMRISTDYMNARLKPEILVIYGDDNDWRVSPKASFEINDNWMVTAGFHIFEGKPQQLNGQFNNNSQFFFETKYSW